MPAFQDCTSGVLYFLSNRIGVKSASSCTIVEGVWLPGIPTFSTVSNGRVLESCSKGGLPRALPTRFPKTRSWKIPYPARTDVFPLFVGSQAIVILAWLFL